MAKARGPSGGNLPYTDSLSAGVLSQRVLFVAIFHGIAAIRGRDLGILQRYQVSPAPRSALVLGKAGSAGIRGLSQAIVVHALALLLHVKVSFAVWHLARMVLLTVLGAGLFSLLSLTIACLVKTREGFMGIGQVATMPIFFASNAINPLDIMPTWLRVVVRANPLTYEVDAVRALMLRGSVAVFGIATDFGVFATVLVLLIGVAARLYGRMAA